MYEWYSDKLRVDELPLEKRIAWLLAFWTLGLGIVLVSMWVADLLPG